ncbi:SDR family oxidoreductase [Sphingomonas sp. DT-207]|uniref:SDR family oxidoreductase n=1 Tax=Sphingomonas sp. DT-207 TaxID=3396167 RepID=UPI003F1A5434
MRIVVAGGTGLVGTKVVRQLEAAGHDVVVAARSTGIDIVTGAGLDRALEGAEIVIDASNPGYVDPVDMLRFFEAAGATLLAAEHMAGIGHHITFSAIGAERIGSGYYRGKHAQEALVVASGIPFTIVRSTPLFEYIDAILDAGRSEESVRVPPLSVQPIATDDAARVLMQVALRDPINAIVEVAGPNIYALPDLAQQILTAAEDYRPVLVDVAAPFFGARPGVDALVTGETVRSGDTGFEHWLQRSLAPA